MGSRLKAARQQRGWSQARLVVELERLGQARGIAVATRASLKTEVSRWENGHVVPDATYAALLAEIYERESSDLGLETAAAPWNPKVVELGPVSPPVLEALGGLLDGYAHADNATGSAPLLGAVTQHLIQLENAAKNARGDTRDQAFALCSRFSEFAGWLSQDSGDLHRAERWTDRALDYLEVLDDPAQRAYVLMRKAAIASELRDHARSLGLVVAARRVAQEHSPTLRTLILRQAAISHALVGEERESRETAEQALEMVAEPSADDYGYCTVPYVLMESGVAAARLRQYDLAADRLAEAAASWRGGSQRDRGLCLARFALVQATRGDIDAACGLAMESLSVAATASSARTQGVLRSLDRRLAPHAAATVVKEYRSQAHKLG